MSDVFREAIRAVKSSEFSFCKFVTANDAGSTGAHQAGIYIPKNSYKLIFDNPGIKGKNEERFATITWSNGTVSECCLKYYGGGTRNEYRITRLGIHFKEGELVVLCRMNRDVFQGFVLFDPMSIDLFLKEFDLDSANLNRLIPHDPLRGVLEDESLDFEEGTKEPFYDEYPELESREVKSASFKPKAHILTLLGEELIKDPVMAIYELVKNSYDADATKVEVQFRNIDDLDLASIVVIDSGTGMTEEVLESVWLEPGTAFRKPYNKEGKRVIVRSPLFKRVPMGEKGVGRFAVHKLGSRIRLISRPCVIVFNEAGQVKEQKLLDYEVSVSIDWNAFTQSEYLSDVEISYGRVSDPDRFYFKNQSGTYIEISALKESWNRGMARQLKRHTLAMTSPKSDPHKFYIDLNFYNNWLDRFPGIDELLEQAPYKLMAFLDKEYNLRFEYSFRLANNPSIGVREIKNDPAYDKNIAWSLRPMLRSYYEEKGFGDKAIDGILEYKLNSPLPFGDFMIELYSYDLDGASLKDITYAPDVLKKALKEQHGIRVFKDDLRVYDYGEPGNDWLGLDLKRVNNKDWFSNNQNIGFVYLDSAGSGSLIEKTNREGFLNNESFDYFRMFIEYVLLQFRVERQKDRQQWIRLNKKEKTSLFKDRVINFVEFINEIDFEDENTKQKLLNEAEQIGKDYDKAQETLLIPAGVGMTASVALHEIEKLVPRMEETVEVAPVDTDRIRAQVEELDEYVSGILSVLKQAGNKPVDVRDSIEQALGNYQLKLRMRKISVDVVIEEGIGAINCDRRYLVTILMNLIDNSIYWLDTIYSEGKSILIKAFKEDGVPRIIVADNGPGFRDSASEIVTPFFTRKEGGIGIGMYLIDTIMMKYGKMNIHQDVAGVNVPSIYVGAIVELVFNKLL